MVLSMSYKILNRNRRNLLRNAEFFIVYRLLVDDVMIKYDSVIRFPPHVAVSTATHELSALSPLPCF